MNKKWIPFLRLGTMFRALKSSNYRLYFAGQSVSLIGSWLTRVAMSWLVYRLSHSVIYLGLVNFSGQIPALIVTPFAGVWLDRWDKKKILVITQVLLMLQALALAALTLSGQIQIWHLLSLSLFQGLVNAFDVPARQSFVVEMIEKREDLGNAIALNSSVFNGSRLIGPAAGGFLIAAAGEGWCFLIDGISYAAVIASFLAMKVKPHQRPASGKGRVWKELEEGFLHSFGFAPVRALLLMVAVISLSGFSTLVLLPVYAQHILGGGPKVLGFLTAASGFGAFIGALTLASRKNVLGLGKTIARAAALGGASLIFFSFSRSLWFSLLMLALGGFGLMVQTASCNTVLQTIVDDDKRGRVMSFYSVAFLGVAPIGSMAVSFIAANFGAPQATFCGGVICLLAALAFAFRLPMLRKTIRPIYVKKGILPEIATGLEATDTSLSASRE